MLRTSGDLDVRVLLGPIPESALCEDLLGGVHVEGGGAGLERVFLCHARVPVYQPFSTICHW